MTDATCNPKSLGVLAYASHPAGRGFTLWHYRAETPLEMTVGENRFPQPREIFAIGDMVLVSEVNAGRILVVAAIADDAVRLVALT